MKKSVKFDNSALSPEAEAWRSQVAAEYAIQDAGGLALLQQACESLDRLREAQGILAKDGVVIHDRFGQPKQHPATLIERDARNAFLKAVRMLNLDVEAPPKRKAANAR